MLSIILPPRAIGERGYSIITCPKVSIISIAHMPNWFRNKHQITGPLFQGRFKSILVDADNYALVLSAYIHLNPLCAGIIRQLEDYPWSSYLDYLNLRKSHITRCL